MSNSKLPSSNSYSLTLGWLYPELMSTYGDRGNIIVLQKIAKDNHIELDILRINQTSDPRLLTSCDLLFMGGAQDLQQEIVNSDLIQNKGEILKAKIEEGTPGLYICGAYQFLGRYYKDSYGTKIPGLGVFDLYTESSKTKPRLIGNIIISPPPASLNLKLKALHFVGFENHGGRTYLADNAQSFATVVEGYGNNGEDKTEGIHYKNSIGTYLHGPILPSNPELAVYLLQVALKRKYEGPFEIKFNGKLAQAARSNMLQRLKTTY